MHNDIRIRGVEGKCKNQHNNRQPSQGGLLTGNSVFALSPSVETLLLLWKVMYCASVMNEKHFEAKSEDFSCYPACHLTNPDETHLQVQSIPHQCFLIVFLSSRFQTKTGKIYCGISSVRLARALLPWLKQHLLISKQADQSASNLRSSKTITSQAKQVCFQSKLACLGLEWG